MMRNLDRRTFLRIGLGSSAAASLMPLALAQQAADRRATAKAVILLYMEGGPSQLDTFDPKPGTRTGGPFKTIDTGVRGIQVTEHLPRLAREMKSLAVLRSVVSREGDHLRGQYYLHTGYRPEGGVTHPGMGCYVSHEIGKGSAELPNFISVHEAPQYSPAFLKSLHAPYPVRTPGEAIENIGYGPDVGVRRFNDRMDLLETLENRFGKTHASAYVRNRRETYRQADKLMHTPALRAFDLLEEDDKLRDAYGRHPFGQGCLLARRLVERGVKFVEVGLGGWDTHSNNFPQTRNLLQTLDPAYATLIRDLRRKGLLDETIVVWMGEFGRTPRINGAQGRDHWPNGFSIVMAGGGIQGGRVIGSTGKFGMEVVDRPVQVEEYAATVYHCLGIDPQKRFTNESGRIVWILKTGKPVKEVLS